MTDIEFKGKTFHTKDFTYGQYRRLLAARKLALDSRDEWKITEALDTMLKTLTDVTDDDLETWKFPEDISTFLTKVGQTQQLPLPPDKSLVEPSSPTPQV